MVWENDEYIPVTRKGVAQKATDVIDIAKYLVNHVDSMPLGDMMDNVDELELHFKWLIQDAYMLYAQERGK